jgi:hypothetical protein
MEVFINYILQFGNLNKQQTDFILQKAKTLELKKEDYFSEAGKVPRYVGFLLEGVMRCCYYNNKGEEITHSFVEENNFVSDQQRFEAQIISSEYIQAETDSKFLVFSKKDWDEIGNTVVAESDRTQKSFGLRRCDQPLYFVQSTFSGSCQSGATFTCRFLPWHHAAITESDKTKCPLIVLFVGKRCFLPNGKSFPPRLRNICFII